MSDSGTPHYSTVSLKLLPAYLGTDSIEAALATARGRRMGPIDFREYRTFAEALHFAYHHH